MAIQEQHVVLNGKQPFYCWRTWGFRRRWMGRLRWKKPPWNTNQHFGAKEVRIIFDFTDPWLLHMDKNSSGCLDLSFLLHGNRLISIYSEKHWWSDYVIWINNCLSIISGIFWWSKFITNGTNWRSSRVSLPSPPLCWHAAGRRSGRPENRLVSDNDMCVSQSETPPQKTSKTPWRKMASLIWIHFETC